MVMAKESRAVVGVIGIHEIDVVESVVIVLFGFGLVDDVKKERSGIFLCFLVSCRILAACSLLHVSFQIRRSDLINHLLCLSASLL